MLKDNKVLIRGGSLLAGFTACATVIHSEGGTVCIDTRLMCAPPPLYMSDLPGERQPNPSEGKPLTITAVTSASASFGMGLVVRARS